MWKRYLIGLNMFFAASMFAAASSENIKAPTSDYEAWLPGPDLESTTWVNTFGLKDDQSDVPPRGWAYQLLVDGIEPLYGTSKARDGRNYLSGLAEDLRACHLKTANLINPQDSTDVRLRNSLSRLCKAGIAKLDALMQDLQQEIPEKIKLVADLQALRTDALDANIYGLTEKDIDERKAEVERWRAKSTSFERKAREQSN